MRYLFDASSIYSVVAEPRTEVLIQNYTCDLVRYELGNIFLTERLRRKTINGAQQESMLVRIKSALSFMDFLTVKGYEQEVIDLAIEYNLTFYDASYAHIAKKIDATLVTEDNKLSRKISNYIKTIKVEEIRLPQH